MSIPQDRVYHLQGTALETGYGLGQTLGAKGALVKLREHQTVLRGARVVLRPLAEEDWDLLVKWNSDPEVLYFAEGDDVSAYTRDEVQEI